MGHFLDAAVPILGAIAGSAVPGLGTALGAALGGGLASGGLNYSHTHNIGSALKSGALSGAGSFVGGNIGDALGAELGVGSTTIGQGLNTAFGSDVGSVLGDLGGTTLGRAAGSVLGGNILGSFAPQGQGSRAGSYPYVPTQAAAAALPKSINSMSSLTPQQQASGLATQGLYGGGIGPEEQSYYGNLLNRQLVDNGGNVSPLSSLSPIEQSFNSKLGFGGETDSNSLLQALSKWHPSNQNA